MIVKRDDLSLDSIPYIDQTVETTFPFHPSSKVDEYRSKGNDGAFDAVTSISSDDFVARSNLPRCNDDATIKRPGCSQRLMLEGSRIANEHREEELWDERQEKDDDAVEICTTSRTTAKNGVDNAAIPVLNLDLSGLDGDTSSNVSSFGKCWKSPEEVRLGYGGRVAALTKHFSKLGDVEPTLIGRRPNSMKLLESSKKFASEPNVASIRARQALSGRFPTLDDDDDDDDDDDNNNHNHCRSELDLRDDEIKRRYLLSIESDRMLEKSIVDLSSENSDPNDCHCRNDLAEVVRGGGSRSTNGKRKLSLSEQRQMIEQLREMSDLGDDSRTAGSSSFPFRSPSLPSFHLLSNRCANAESSNGVVVDEKPDAASAPLLLREMQANIQRFASSWPMDIGGNCVEEKKDKRSLVSVDGKLIKTLSNSYPNVEKARELLRPNENENEQPKRRWCCNSKECSLAIENRLGRATSSFLTNQRCARSLNEDSSRDNRNDENGAKARCKQSFIVGDLNSEGRNHFDVLPIEIDQQGSMTIERETLTSGRSKDLEADTKLDQDWKISGSESKICPRSSETRLDIGFLLRKQLILLSHIFRTRACQCLEKVSCTKFLMPIHSVTGHVRIHVNTLFS